MGRFAAILFVCAALIPASLTLVYGEPAVFCEIQKDQDDLHILDSFAGRVLSERPLYRQSFQPDVSAPDTFAYSRMGIINDEERIDGPTKYYIPLLRVHF